MIEAALFNSGRPTLIVPYIQKAGFSVERVLCCWDGSRAAARAIGDACRCLHKADSVKVLTVSTGKFDESDVTGADLADPSGTAQSAGRADAHSGRRYRRRERDPLACRRFDASLIVMGGYGHSRLRDFVLGGATRGMLQSMTVPTLMSH